MTEDLLVYATLFGWSFLAATILPLGSEPALFATVLERGIQAGVFRSCDPLVMCQLAIAPLMFSCLWQQSFAGCEVQTVSPDLYVQTHLDMFMRGLLCEPPPARSSR